jgi:chromosome segregation ATPase
MEAQEIPNPQPQKGHHTMEQRLDKLEVEHRTLLKRVEDLEKEKETSDFTLKDIKHETTIIHGIAVVKFDELHAELVKASSRLERIDDRVTEAHTELAELRLEHSKRFDQIERTMATKDDIVRIEATQQEILALLKQNRS